MDFFISTAHAADPGAQGDSLMSLVPLILVFVIFYFLLIRPQSKRQKEHQQMVSSLERGDEVVTNGGVIGKLTHVGEQFVTVEIADSIEIKLQRHAVTAVLPKGTVKSA
jgi:preprotein translocase subunit YajC